MDLAPLQPQQMSGDQARTFLEQLAALDDKLALLSAQAQAYRDAANAAQAIAPVTPQAEPLRPLPRLDSSGWAQALTFLSARVTKAEAARARSRRADARALPQAPEARGRGEPRRRSGPTRRLEGDADARGLGPRHRARDLPRRAGALDAELRPAALSPTPGRCASRFSGQVSQETTEDWSNAQLTLSTAVPRHRGAHARARDLEDRRAGPLHPHAGRRAAELRAAAAADPPPGRSSTRPRSGASGSRRVSAVRAASTSEGPMAR